MTAFSKLAVIALTLGAAFDATACLIPASAQIQYSYDARDRETGITYPDSSGNLSKSYDPDSHLLSASTPVAAWSYTWNKRGLPETEQVVIDGHTWTLNPASSAGTHYDAIAHLNQTVYPDSRSVAYTPDAWGEPTRIGSYASNLQYWPNGMASSSSLGSGVNVGTTLDTRQRLASQTVTGSTTLQSLSYGYNTDSDLTRITDQVDGSDNATLGYDGLHRLSSAAGVWGNYSYSYDALNNLKTRTGSSALTYTYDTNHNRLSSVTGALTRTYAYNAIGQPTSDGTKTYVWNQANQISRISGVASYGYDANAKRIKTTLQNGNVEYDLYDLQGQLAYSFKPATNTQTDFLDLNGKPLAELANGTPTYLHPDLLGSPRLATGPTQTILWREHFDPYGQKLNNGQDRTGYTGHAYDAESGLTYAQARYYDPQIGRFLSTDPKTFTDTDPYSFNRYAYVNDSPYDHTDPTGESTLELGFLIADSIELGNAINSGQGVGLAALNVVIDAIAVASPAPGISEAAHVIEGAVKVGEGAKAIESAKAIETGSSKAAEGIAGAGSAANVANGVRLGEQLSLESANSAFTASGELSEGAIQNATQIFEPGTLSNPAIPEGFGKYTTETFASPSGPFQSHFYMNPTTGEVFYGLDYKAVFNTAFGP